MKAVMPHPTAERCVSHRSGSGRSRGLRYRQKLPGWSFCPVPAWCEVSEMGKISCRVSRRIVGAVVALMLAPVGIAQAQSLVLMAATAAILSPGETLYLSLARTGAEERTMVGSAITYEIVISNVGPGVDAEGCVQVIAGSLAIDAPRRTAALTALGTALTTTFDGEPGPTEVVLDNCFAGSPQILVEFRVPLPGQRAIDPPHLVVAGVVARGTETRIATEELTIVHEYIERIR